MRVLSYLGHLLLAILKALAYEWIFALIALVKQLVEIARRWRSRHSDGRARKASRSPCNKIDEPAFHRPDPTIYSQYDLMAQGYAVTWDNPDIELRKGGAPVSSASGLDPSTDYEIVARIWNKSTDAPVVGLSVFFYYLSFGSGVKGHIIGATAVNLGVKGGPDHPAFASMKWTTPPVAGHYCLMVLLAPVDDLNFANNLGQENLNVAKPKSPAGFTFQLRNEKPRAERFRFEADTYRLPELPPCDQRQPPPPPPPQDGHRMPETRARAVPPQHDRRNYPIPVGWGVTFTPAEPELPAGGEMPVQVTINAPAGFAGRQSFNVNVFDREGFTGGVTLVVEAP